MSSHCLILKQSKKERQVITKVISEAQFLLYLSTYHCQCDQTISASYLTIIVYLKNQKMLAKRISLSATFLSFTL